MSEVQGEILTWAVVAGVLVFLGMAIMAFVGIAHTLYEQIRGKW